jgi:AraC family cel operon transcriptional repressor
MARRRSSGGRTRHIRLRELIGPDSAFKIARTVAGERGFWREHDHDHDFPEMFWIQSGEGLHVVNRRRIEIAAGFLCMMRPADRHNFYGAAGKPLAIMNIAFPAATLEHYRRRYFPGGKKFFWTRARLPFSTRLDASTLSWLNASARELAARTDSKLLLDRFFAEVFLRLERSGGDRAPVPEWLRAALAAYRGPEQFRTGVAGFVELAGRGREHVNRSLRRCLGITTTEAVNRARLRWAADELCFTDRPILEICYDAGCANVGHFYKLFRERFGTTPKAWRRRHRELGEELI